jgi:hypothetical protein
MLVERLEEGIISCFVSSLRTCETASVDSIVNVRVDKLVDPVDLSAYGQRIKVGIIACDAAEFAIKHANDLVVHYPPRVVVAQGRHGNLSSAVRIGGRIRLMEMAKGIDHIRGTLRKMRVTAEQPALLTDTWHNAYASMIARSSFFSARKIIVRCAQGQLYAT